MELMEVKSLTQNVLFLYGGMGSQNVFLFGRVGSWTTEKQNKPTEPQHTLTVFPDSREDVTSRLKPLLLAPGLTGALKYKLKRALSPSGVLIQPFYLSKEERNECIVFNRKILFILHFVNLEIKWR